jgi:aerobic-type carbon monoxide dehydrogenase small subunit (CoxS/CutS family)
MLEEENKKDNNARQTSRREFLKEAGLLAGGVTIGSLGLLSACQFEDKAKTVTNTVTNNVTSTVTKMVTVTGTGALTPIETTGLVKVSLTVNNQQYEVFTSPELTLQEVLKDKLGFISIKDMCTGYGACGTCTAVVNGKPALTCMLLTSECDGAVIETAEGIANSGHPLIESYVKYDAMQCGFCTPGFVTTAKALLDRNPNPTVDEINEAMAGNLCRCGTYPQHSLAVLDAAQKLGGFK